MRASSERLAAVAITLCAALSLGLAACGSDDETTTEPPTATIPTVEQTNTETTTEATTTATTTDYGEVEAEPGDDGPGQGGGDDSTGPGSGGAAVPDTPENDVTPPANTPEGQFEQFCNENPGACG